MNLAGTVLGDISSFSLTSGYLLSNSFDLQALIVKSMLIDDIALFGTHLHKSANSPLTTVGKG